MCAACQSWSLSSYCHFLSMWGVTLELRVEASDGQMGRHIKATMLNGVEIMKGGLSLWKTVSASQYLASLIKARHLRTLQHWMSASDGELSYCINYLVGAWLLVGVGRCGPPALLVVSPSVYNDWQLNNDNMKYIFINAHLLWQYCVVTTSCIRWISRYHTRMEFDICRLHCKPWLTSQTSLNK